MSRNIILVLFGIIFFSSGFNLAYAEVIINEVQLLPTSERFIELYNTGDSAVNLTNWLMQRKTLTSDSFSSLVTSLNFEGKSIGAKDYFVISRVQIGNSDIVVNTLTLTESNTIQIKISGASEIIDKISWGGVADCINPCPPNPAEGQSLQRTVSGSWIVATPTPGTANEIIPPPSSSSDSTPATSSTTSSGGTGENPSLKNLKKEQKIKTKILAKNFAFVGVPVEFEANTTGYYGEMLPYGKYFWNFGDGDFKEMKVNEEKFSHIYFYPGEYAVSLEYYMNYASANPEAVDKIIIKTITPDVLISNVGNEADFFVELTNSTNYDADISQWILSSDKVNFVLPKNTILGPQKKMILSPRITNLSIADKDFLKLMTPQWDVIFDYTASLAPVLKKVSVQNQLRQSEKIIFNNSNSLLMPQEENKNTEITTQDLSASPILAEAKENNWYFIILFVFLGITSGAVYFIRRTKNSAIAGDDFELLDE
ncbi:MAG: lamin tail domain-containing protein [Patescibacteria group bacterium]